MMKTTSLLQQIISLAALVLTFTSCQDNSYKTVSPDEFAELIKDSAVQLVDVRTPKEYADGFIPGAMLIDAKEDAFLSHAQSQLSADRPVAVYCRSGRRSANAAKKLAKAGYQVINLKGGILAWEDEGRETCEQAGELQSEAVRQRVKEIYQEIFDWYIAHTDDMQANEFDSPEILSQDYWNTYLALIQLNKDLGEIDLLDHDHWIQGQDWDEDLDVRINDVQMEDSQHALVSISITNCGVITDLSLAMIRQNNKWYIDDFINDPSDDTPRSEKTLMKQYLEESKNISFDE